MPLSGAPLAGTRWTARTPSSADFCWRSGVSSLTLGACLTLKLPTSGRQQATIGLPCSTRRLPELFEMMGLPSLARGERARARLDREGAATELERAQLRHTHASRL